MIRAKLSSKYQLSIPKAMRDELGLQAGQQFTLVARGNIIELIPFQPLAEAKGMLEGWSYSSSDEYRDRDREDQY